MKRSEPDLPEWSIEIDEVSAGAYEIVAVSVGGRKYARTGIDPEKLLEEFREEARTDRIANKRSGNEAT